jgi:hypothetical protein
MDDETESPDSTDEEAEDISPEAAFAINGLLSFEWC